MFETPVLLIIFNRSHTTQRTFDAIKQIKPKQLFVVADGPRPHVPSDIEHCRAARSILEQVDWECDVHKLFREENRGCGHGPAEGITWFFSQVEEGIILEDDCLPSDSFFSFCAELLERYRNEEKIGIISGTNQLKRWRDRKQSYLFSLLGTTCGWATWRRAWKHFDYSASAWRSNEGQLKVQESLQNKAYFSHFASEFNFYFQKKRTDVWDFQWYFARLHRQPYSIVPTVNLISNIGFDNYATHSFNTKDPMSNIPYCQLQFPLKHPPIKIDKFYDWFLFERFINPQERSLLKKVILKILKITIRPVVNLLNVW